nr:hypothetical protein [Tanacetum cinerariifolium]
MHDQLEILTNRPSFLTEDKFSANSGKEYLNLTYSARMKVQSTREKIQRKNKASTKRVLHRWPLLEENDFQPRLKNSLVASYAENGWIQNALSSYHEIKQEKDTPGLALYLHEEEVVLLAGNLRVREEGNLQPGKNYMEFSFL